MKPKAAASEAAEGEQEHKYTNRLAKEQSPYLLQHAHNPVDWYPWSQEAFEAAKAQDKPIFLSVGYATCHWCHVMERESFESEETAAIMNKHFINVKVDREERPDVDKVYMTFVQASTGGGGWPMSVWLTPDLKPFYGGTYYPDRDVYGMPSFATVLRSIAQAWGTRRGDLEQQASSVLQQLEEITSSSPPGSPAAAANTAAAAVADPRRLLAAVQAAAIQLGKGFDAKLGGFRGAPKFPRPSEINLLLRAGMMEDGSAAAAAAAAGGGGSGKAAAAAGKLSPSQLRHIALYSLQAMAAGGMYDQLGGGFHRYSVDEYWHVPHFEKMLYDNPQLALTYLDAFRMTLAAKRGSSISGPGSSADSAAAAADAGLGLAAVPAGSSSGSKGLGSGGSEDARLADPRVYATVVRGVLDYLKRDMTHPEGGLYSAEDADSLDPSTGKKSEGAFYVWTESEVKEVLGAERVAVFNEVYGVKPQGNCTLSPKSDPHDEFTDKNVLMQFKQLDAAATVQSAGMGLDAAEELLGGCRRELWDRRAARPRPALDDKIVTAWNGQGISAFALASRALAAELPPPRPCFPVDACPAGSYLEAALRIADFLHRHVWDEGSGRLKRAYCNAPSNVEGFADDYALLIEGLLNLYEAGGGLQWLQWAVQLQDTLDSLFWDGNEGGYFQGSGTDPSIKLRLKEDYDGAEPAASSIAAANLIRLGALLPHGASPSTTTTTTSSSSASSSMSYAARGDAVLAAFFDRVEKAGVTMPQMAVAAWLKAKTPLRQVIIAGQPSHPTTQALLDAAHAAWAPDKALMLIDPSSPESVGFWRQQNPEAWAMVENHFRKAGPAAAAGSGTSAAAAAAAAAPAGAGDGSSASGAEAAAGVAASEVAAGAAAAAGSGYQPTAFVCQNYTCQAPTSSPDKLYDLLSAKTGGGTVKLMPVKL